MVENIDDNANWPHAADVAIANFNLKGFFSQKITTLVGNDPHNDDDNNDKSVPHLLHLQQ